MLSGHSFNHRVSDMQLRICSRSLQILVEVLGYLAMHKRLEFGWAWSRLYLP